MGIDGFSFMLHEPIQVKQSDHIGRNVVDNFETAVQRNGKQKGYIVGFSFTKGAYEEVARAKRVLGLDIELVTISSVLRDVKTLITPVGGRRITDVPLPKRRPADALPSVDELIRSDLRSLPGRDEEPIDRRPEDSAPSGEGTPAPKRGQVRRRHTVAG